ncbi:dihydrodipicolinate synthase family protein [Hoeflea prorocentri]|uniref:Dihydrodipicolinate synthase family protein n=1 Tax=Hoeflea prorocentri TaxID=1922333 RepID=A0A9X3UN66_9HYPH|nr:dihydrodipicolinate synthase family protein [Hoeflea prorocentri]MCY6382294.1 dihydrodipicolinate synthase family protein [Hoeflea prorocentri]MDA5400094.1 dihydrodipicolinate synthase family protein [Hoeflea prorocentri]
MLSLSLPTYNNRLEDYRLSGDALTPRAPRIPLTRTAFAAAHVVSDPRAERDPWLGSPAVDWDNTLGFRNWLWDQGLGLAEAMDTAQRGMGVDWPTAKELIERTMREARAHPLRPRVACGAGTDQKDLSELRNADDITAAYGEQMEAIEAAGGQIILMASRAFPAIKAGPDEYAKVYGKLLDQASEPVILHWLGDMFDPALTGYWGSNDVGAASDAVLSIINAHEKKVDGIKISLLDRTHEEAFRARLPDGVRLYTGDDFNYADLIEGDGTRFSHALLGAFAAIAPAASQALEALAEGDTQAYRQLFDPTVPLSREIFKTPTQFYKAGIAFLAWLNDAQSHFIMPGGFQSSREITHYAEVFRLADKARLLSKPDVAAQRMTLLLKLHGIE